MKRTTPCAPAAATTTKSAAWPRPSTPCCRASKPASSSSSAPATTLQAAYDQAQGLAEETRHTNRKLELEVQVRSKIEKKLTGFQNYLNSIIDSMPSALIALDEQLYVTQWNQEASALSGTRLDEALEPADLPRLPTAQTLPAADSRPPSSNTRVERKSSASPGSRTTSPSITP